MITRYWGLPKLEYQILTSRSPLGSWLFESGARPTVRAAASLVSKISCVAGPASVDAGRAGICCAKEELGIASRSEAARVSRLMFRGLFTRVEGHNYRPHPENGC